MQHGAAESYARTRQAVAGPRELEASLLAKAAGRLQLIRDDWTARRAELDAALTYNRKLWAIFVGAVSQPENPLPLTVKQNIANLGLFIFNHTIGIMAAPEPQKLSSLISINRAIAEGLRGMAGPAPARP